MMKPPWGTAQEITFLLNLRMKNPEAFENYRTTVHERVNWDAIEKEHIVAFLERNRQEIKQSD